MTNAKKAAKKAPAFTARTLVLHMGGAESQAVVKAPTTTPEQRAQLAAAISSALGAEKEAQGLAVQKAWAVADAGGEWYRAALGVMSDAEAWKALASWNEKATKPEDKCLLQRAGVDVKRCNYLGKAMRGRALGIAPLAGEGVKEYAARCGGLHASRSGKGGASKDTPKAKLAALERAVAMLADAATKAREGDAPAKVAAMIDAAAKALAATVETRKAAATASADA